MYSYSHQTLSVSHVHYSPSGSASVYPDERIQILKMVRDTPDAVRRTKPEDLFANGTSRSAYSRYYGHNACTIQVGTYDYDIYGGDSIHRIIDMSPVESAPLSWTSLENKVRSKIRSDYMNLAQSMAEYRQTVDLFVDYSSRFIKIARGLVRRDPSVLFPRKQWSKAAASNWLQFQFGVIPLMSDIEGGVNALYARTLLPLYRTGRVSLRASSDKTSVLDAFYLGRKIGQANKYSRTDSFQMLNYRCQFDLNQTTSTISRLGLSNPAVLAWELIPFSFVVDWFVNVGDCLQSLDTSSQISSLEVIRSSKVKSTTAAARKSGLWSGSGTYDEIVYNRTSPAALSLIVRPEYNPNLNITRLLNSLALLRQLKK